MNDRFLNLLGLCRRAGRMKIGCDTVIESVELKEAKLVLMASDISENTKKKVISVSKSVVILARKNGTDKVTVTETIKKKTRK